MKNLISIIDYNAGNLFSIDNALKKLSYNAILTNDCDQVLKSDAIIIPGVGSFKSSMSVLKKKKLDKAILKFYELNRPILGICLGFQILFSESEEFGSTKGLGIIKGKIKNLSKLKIKTPNVGWYKQVLKKKNIKFIDKKSFYYFVHSYFADPKDKKIISSYIKIKNTKFCSSILYKNVFGIQFHPEKSGSNGLNLIDKFLIKHGIQKI